MINDQDFLAAVRAADDAATLHRLVRDRDAAVRGAELTRVPIMAASSNNSSGRPPRVCLIGDHEHPDFADAVALIQGDADLMFDISPRTCAELIILARSRPGMIGRQRVDQLRRTAPLAGIVALLGSWCEGQARASRPRHDVQRLYWYRISALVAATIGTSRGRPLPGLGAAGRCRRPFATTTCSVLSTQYSDTQRQSGVILLNTPHWETAGRTWPMSCGPPASPPYGNRRRERRR